MVLTKFQKEPNIDTKPLQVEYTSFLYGHCPVMNSIGVSHKLTINVNVK